MLKRIILFVATFAIIAIAYTIYSWREEPLAAPQPEHEGPRRALTEVATQPAPAATLTFRDAKIPPGESPSVRILDDKGNTRIAFQATRWQAVRDNAFHVSNPNARLLLPSGQLAYIWGDEGEVELQRGEGNNFNPKRGWLRGNVLIVVDRTKPDWREEHPDLLEPEQHPEMIVKIWLEDVNFDLDLGRLESKGRILVQSPDGSLEGHGLELIWNEATRQVRKLRITEGDRAIIRTAANVDFGVGDVKDVVEDSSTTQPSEDAAREPAPAKAAEAEQKRAERITFQKTGEQSEPRLKEDRVDTYQIEFHDNVVAEQKDGVRINGRLQGAKLLQLVCDIGRAERASIEHPQTQPAGAPRAGKKAATTQPARQKPSAAALAAGAGQNAIEVHWSGELIAMPIAEGSAATQPTGLAGRQARQRAKTRPAEQPQIGAKPRRAERMHLLAVGSPVEVYDRQAGSVVCEELEYHAETKQIWLRGTREKPVSMAAGADRQFWGEQIFVDRQYGVARVEGAGRMLQTRHREKSMPECLSEGDKALAEDATGTTADISWTKAVQLEFGIAAVEHAAATEPAQAEGDKPRSEKKKVSPLGFLQHAVFEGGVVMRQQDETISADLVEAHFIPPKPGAEEGKAEGAKEDSVIADRLLAIGNVRLSRGSKMDDKAGRAGKQAITDDVTCDRLDVEMTVDDAGKNVPKIGRAIGHVFAKRITGQTHREIRASDELVLTLASVPRPITPEEQARLEAAAKRCGKDSSSPEWQAFEARLRNRRRIIAANISGSGDVQVHMRGRDKDKRNLDLAADSLDCSLREDEEITRALVVGREEQPATVDLGDVYVKGPQIAVDMLTQSLDVPGAGTMRLVSKQDLTGRAADEPMPIVVNWQRDMSFRGKENIANFDGDVRAVAGTTTLDCRELRVQFEDVAPPPAQVTATAPWVLKPIFGATRKDQGDKASNRMADRWRKRPTYMRGSGDVVIVSTDYAKAATTSSWLGQTYRRWVLDRFPNPATKPAEERGPMLSRFRVAGPLVGVNLKEEHFSVEGIGNLLIEDFRLPDETKAAARITAAPTGLIDAPTGLDSGGGPSQTLFRWQNSMSYLNKRNVAVFDKQVVMDHVSGSKMVLWEELAASMKLDPKRLAKVKSRQAHLTCDNLLVEFLREISAGKSRPPIAGGMRLSSLQSTGNVLMEMDEGKQSVTGTLINYRESSGDVRVIGSAQVPAQVMMQDERSGIFRIYRADPGDPIEWNQRTGTVRVGRGTMHSTGGK